jgi:hypothetical protein
MSTETQLCMTCRGNKELPGMGGIIKTCWNCKGKGRIPVVKAETSTIDHAVILNMAAQSTDEVVSAIKAKPKRKSRAKTKEPETVDMFTTYVDPLMQAVLDEPRMKPDEWQRKYKDVPGLFGKDIATGATCEAVSKVERAAMRANYAANQPKVKRKVDVSAAQDLAAEGDANYRAFKEKQETLNVSQ